MEIPGISALFMRKVDPLAGQGTDRSREAPTGTLCEKVGQIEELLGGVETLSLMWGQLDELGRTRFGRDGAAHVIDDAVSRSVDPAASVAARRSIHR